MSGSGPSTPSCRTGTGWPARPIGPATPGCAGWPARTWSSSRAASSWPTTPCCTPASKWLLRVLRDVPEQPPGLMAAIDAVVAEPDLAAVDTLVACVREFRDWGIDPDEWGARFMLDTELAWMQGHAAIADL